MITGFALLVGTAALAADEAPQELVVTGSRIPSPNLTSISPVAAITDTELKFEGTTNVETLLNELPQVFADYGADVSNGATGTATVNLRGLGSSRTLVLIDGRRLMPGDPSLPSADLNTIPAALVKRVDIVTGGASAVYGSDALAGVVNFIMKRDFEGVRVDSQYSFFTHDNNNSTAQTLLQNANRKVPTGGIIDGKTYDATIILGANSPDKKGNVTAYVGYHHSDAITQDHRDFSACSLSSISTTTSSVYDTHVCQGSSNSAFGRFRPLSGANAGMSFSDNPDGTNSFVKYSGALSFNFAPYNYFQRDDERYSAGYFAHYDLTPNVEVYSDFMFADDHTLAQIAPSGLFQGHTYNINCNNPLIDNTNAGYLGQTQLQSICGVNAGTATQVPLLIGYRFGGAGVNAPRTDDIRHTSYKIDLGFKGDIGGGWSYDVYGQFGTSIYAENYLNDVSINRVQNALLVDPTTGKCINDTVRCVPLNLFSTTGVTQAAFGYVKAPAFKEGHTTEQVLSGSLVGDLGHYGVKSPLAHDGVGVALGAEYRKEASVLATDLENSSGDLSGSGGATAPANGSFDVKEVFGELRIPLIQDLPFVKSLQLETGYRFSSYSSSGSTHSYKFGAEYSPFNDLRIRASYNRATRAPNVVELATPLSPGLYGGQDPCAGGAASRPSLAACQATNNTESAAVFAAQYAAGSIPTCPSAQCSTRYGHDPLTVLKPEVSDTYSVGFVFQPHWLPSFNLSVDYFDIKVNGFLNGGYGGAAVEVSQCIQTQSPVFCSQIHRDPGVNGVPGTGALFGDNGFVTAATVNTGFLKTDGLDIESNNKFSFKDIGHDEWGSISFNSVGTYTDHLTTQPAPGVGTYNCAGLYGVKCGTPTPHFRSKFRVTWNTPWPLTVSAQWRFIGPVAFDGNTANPFLTIAPAVDVIDAHIKSQNYFDLSANYKIKDRYTIRVGINNLLDKDPPVVDSSNVGVSSPPFGNGNTFPQVYDSLGRQIFVGVTADF